MAKDPKNSESLPIENIVLVGRTGTGKSSTGNSIVGSGNPFLSKSRAKGVTETCQSVIATTPEGQKLNVIDTPGLLDLTLSAEIISKEIINCLHLAEGGLHAVLLVFTTRARATDEEQVVLRTLETLFGSKICDYVILVFTAGDELEYDHETLDDYLKECPLFLQKLLESCAQRKILFNNRTDDEEKKKKQVHELLNLIDQVRKHNNNIPYTTEMYNKIQEEKDRHKKEKEDLADQGHSDEKFEELLKEIMQINQQNLNTMAKMMEENMRMALDGQQKLFERMETSAEARHHEEQEDMMNMFDKMENTHYNQELEMMKGMGDMMNNGIAAASMCNIL